MSTPAPTPGTGPVLDPGPASGAASGPSSGSDAVAVVGIACRYPDADSPEELWQNVLAGRRAFRRLPDERLRAEDYWSADRSAPDRTYAMKAAVLEGFAFDRVRHRVPGSTFRATDMTHWLALDTAARALEDAGFPAGAGLPAAATGVIIGNTLTGEFSRANAMRLRWPYVRRTVTAALRDQGWEDADLAPFLQGLEERYKAPFPPVGEDSLAGGLSNTIAGRICNHFDLGGGGFTVDGACSSSLLSVTTACEALAAGRLDVALAGGVDLSIDPFELIGFAKTGALAEHEMRVYDRGSNGFWPGEGCGMLVLMRSADAVAQGRFRYAEIAGWGYSSDGAGGITRPEATGHRLAMARAYDRAGFGMETVGYFEGHGTGTAVGDATELRAFSESRRAAGPGAGPAAISTVKGNLGHTKAAAGAAGLLKAVLAVRHQVIPPGTGHRDPHPELLGEQAVLRVPARAELWPPEAPVRAGVSSMGFGGINAHVVVQQAGDGRRTELGDTTRSLVASRQDVELLLLDADSPAELRSSAARLAALAGRLSHAEIGDLAATLQRELADRPVRAAVVAASPDQAEQRLDRLVRLLDDGTGRCLDDAGGVFLGGGRGRAPRIGLLFPGQGTGHRSGDGALRRRFPLVDELYGALALPAGADPVATSVAQPRIVAGSAGALRMLAALGIEPVAATGHSLGELTALHWAGAMDEAALLRIAAARGRIMAETGESDGTMAAISAPPARVEPLLLHEPVVIAGYNSPRRTVVSGPVAAVRRVCAAAAAQDLGSTQLRVSHAFHSRAVAPAAESFARHLAGEPLRSLRRPMVSSVTGQLLPPDTDLTALLTRQMLQPVRFTDAVRTLSADTDLLLEVGPGSVLRTLAAEIAPTVPALSIDTDSDSLAGLLNAAAACFALGAPLRHRALFADRFTRPFPLDKELSFLASPCEEAPADATNPVPAAAPAPGAAGTGPVRGAAGAAGDADPDAGRGPAAGVGPQGDGPEAAGTGGAAGSDEIDAGEGDSLTLLLRLAAERAELPASAIDPGVKPLDDLHLSSITVGDLMNQACRELGLDAPAVTTAFATSTLAELAELLDELAAGAERPAAPAVPPGVAPWVRAFSVELLPAGAGRAVHAPVEGRWRLFADDRHPFAAALAEALEGARLGDGVLLCLPADCDDSHVGLMLAAAKAALAVTTPARDKSVHFVAVGDRRGAAGLAKTLHLEAPQVVTTVVTLPVPPQLPEGRARELTAGIVADVAATDGFSEVHYGRDGVRRVPVLRPVPPGQEPAIGREPSAERERAGLEPSAEREPAGPARFTDQGSSGGPESAPGAPPLGRDDVVLVTGGGKGITAECALMLGAETGAALALLGRSDPAADPELAANLERMTAAGVTFRYIRADLTSVDEVKSAVSEVRSAFGPVTAVLHGAGRNEPRALADLDEADFRRTLATKVTGLETVLAATDAAALRLLVTFGSIIGRAGLRGEADYATANDWLTDLTLRIQEEYGAGCRCLALEWSVWSGSGMGERLGVLESLIREGIDPIPADEGVAMLRRLLADPLAPSAPVVMGRAGGLPTLTLEPSELPLLRFADSVRAHYPGIELVADSVLSAAGDPYLADHQLDGDLLFPAVLGMEAMAQAAAALTGRTGPPALDGLEFLRPIVVPPAGETTIRVAALVGQDGSVRTVIRSSETGFQVDHFRATARYGLPLPDGGPPRPVPADAPRSPLDPAAELYGPVLFQGARFQRLRGYRALSAYGCVAEIAGSGAAPWFAGYLPADLVLADPGARDAMMHAIQACVPDATLLPVSVERLCLADPNRPSTGGALALHAVERSRTGDTYVYDLDVRDEAGALVERWQGLCLRAVRKADGSGPWLPALLGGYLERRVEAALGVAVRCVVLPDPVPAGGDTVADRRSRTAAAAGWALGRPAEVRYRPDGRPEVAGGPRLSASHGAGVTLAVLGADPVACDVQPVGSRSAEQWGELLGADGVALARLLAAERSEELSSAATRVWGAVECMRKLGRATVALTLGEPAANAAAAGAGWAVLRCGDVPIATFVTALAGTEAPVVFAVTTRGDEGR